MQRVGWEHELRDMRSGVRIWGEKGDWRVRSYRCREWVRAWGESCREWCHSLRREMWVGSEHEETDADGVQNRRVETSHSCRAGGALIIWQARGWKPRGLGPHADFKPRLLTQVLPCGFTVLCEHWREHQAPSFHYWNGYLVIHCLH